MSVMVSVHFSVDLCSMQNIPQRERDEMRERNERCVKALRDSATSNRPIWKPAQHLTEDQKEKVRQAKAERLQKKRDK